MKLRNKKTGNILTVEFLSNWQTDDGVEIGFRVRDTDDVYSYNSLDELNKEWEDYIPKEPLIRFDDVRKIVRLWADFNGFKQIKASPFVGGTRFSFGIFDIDFSGVFIYLDENKKYHITELCGK